MEYDVTVIGGGLAGCEAAWQLAERGLLVRLTEMKPLERSPAQKSDLLAELVCSNSLRSANPMNAVGLLKEEMARLGSLVMRCALRTRVPAGDALAVDRDAFSGAVTDAITAHPRILRHSQCVTDLPPAEDGPVVVATGPLTANAFANAIVSATGQERMFFYDAIAPIVSGDSVDRDVVFAASRYGKGGGDDYLNCPMNREQYDAFLSALLSAETMPLHSFEEPRFFQGCLPIEVVAASGPDTLRYGTMKPVGLTDPRTGSRAYAVVQLRQEDPDGQAFNLVGFQTKLKHPEQKRVLRMIPGLENAQFLRLGAVHRNTYLDSPALLNHRMCLRSHPHVRFAGQVTGVEGYVESAAHGLVTGLMAASDISGAPMPPPPAETAIGALVSHVLGERRIEDRPHEPQNVNWGLFPPAPAGTRKRDRKQVRVERGRAAFTRWAEQVNIPLLAISSE